MNRPVRSRMQGGVGGWELVTPGYPISCFYWLFRLTSTVLAFFHYA
jgi:hypothetical protein